MRDSEATVQNHVLSETERQQLEQTVQMFEAIVDSQPLDCQSLEILKEAYAKLGREADVIRTSKRLAQSYLQLGQVSSAILEYEAVLHANPEDQEALEALAQIDARVVPTLPLVTQKPAEHKAEPPPKVEPVVEKPTPAVSEKPAATSAPAAAPPKTKPPTSTPTPPPGTEVLAPKLTLKQPLPSQPTSVTVPEPPKPPPAPKVIVNDGQDEMYRIFVESKIVAPGDFELYWPIPPAVTDKVIEPFIQVLADQKLLEIEKSLKILIEKARVPYIPLERYDIDFDLARRFPAQTCLKWCVLPFDRLGKTTLVATANPFNKTALEELSEHTPNRLIYYLATPTELIKAIKKAFRVQ